MSCFVMDDRAVSAIANTIDTLLFVGYNYFGFECPESLREALHGCTGAKKIYTALYKTNLQAYNGRYRESIEEIPEFTDDCEIKKRPEYKDHHYVVQPWHYQFAKLVDCYIYQLEEEATRNSPILAGMKDLREALFRFIVGNSDEYQAAPWGSL